MAPKKSKKEPKTEAQPLPHRRVSKAERPMSPHLSIYRWQVTNTLSILHRLTGAVLLLGFLLLVVWLVSAALGPVYYDCVQKFITSCWGTIILFGFTLAFYYHLLNGVRHLLWDVGYGFELSTVNFTGVATVLGTLLLTAATWWHLLNKWIGL